VLFFVVIDGKKVCCCDRKGLILFYINRPHISNSCQSFEIWWYKWNAILFGSKYDDSIANDNAKNNNARNHLNSGASMGGCCTGIGIGAGVDAVQSTPAVNQNHASKNISNCKWILHFQIKSICPVSSVRKLWWISFIDFKVAKNSFLHQRLCKTICTMLVKLERCRMSIYDNSILQYVICVEKYLVGKNEKLPSLVNRTESIVKHFNKNTGISHQKLIPDISNDRSRKVLKKKRTFQNVPFSTRERVNLL